MIGMQHIKGKACLAPTVVARHALPQQEGYDLAKRYIANAKEALKKAGRDGRYFKDSKYVSSASGIAYRGVLVALDTWLQLKGVELPQNTSGKKERKSIEFYRDSISKLDKKLLRDLNGVYDALHLFGYYDCTLLTNIIDGGFEIANEIIDRINPQPGGAR